MNLTIFVEFNKGDLFSKGWNSRFWRIKLFQLADGKFENKKKSFCRIELFRVSEIEFDTILLFFFVIFCRIQPFWAKYGVFGETTQWL